MAKTRIASNDGEPVTAEHLKAVGAMTVLLKEAPGGFTVPVRDIRAYTGAGWLVALCGEMMTMPGLGATPAAAHVDIDEQGRTVGLF